MVKENIQDKISQGISLISNEKYEAAKELFNEVISESPRTLEAYVHLGNTYANLEEYDEAIETFKKALLVDGSFAEAYFSIGSIYVLKEDYLKAIENFNKAEEEGYKSSNMYQLMASIFFSVDDESQAIRNISRAINMEPLNGYLRIFKAQIYLANNKYELAIDTLDEMEKILPDAFDVYDVKSQVYLAEGKISDALETIERGINRFPKDPNLAVVKLRVLVEADKTEDAETWIKHMKDNDMYNPVIKEASVQESTLLIKKEKYKEACNLLKDANTALDTDPDLIYLIVDLLGAMGENEELLKYSELLSNREYGDFYYATAMYFHAIANEALGNEEEAKKEYKDITVKLRRETIDNPGFYEGYLYRLLSHTKIKEYDKALDLADFIENLYPEKADSHAFKHYIYREMGDLEASKREGELAKSINSNLLIK